MASTASDLIKFEKMATGEKSGTWGTLANKAMSRIEESIAGFRAITLAGSTYVLDDTQFVENSTTTAESHLAMIKATGTPGASRQITVPQRTKLYLFWNAVTTYDMTVAAASGDSITVTNGNLAWVFCDGTNVELASPMFTTAGVLDMKTATGIAVTDSNFIVGNGTTFVAESGATAMTSLGGIVTDTTPQLGGFLDTNSKFISHAQGTAIASVAGDTDIWANFDGNTVHITGTNAITDFGTPKSAGDSMWVIFDAAASVVDSATITVAGNTNYQAAANDLALVYALTTSTFLFMPFPNSGSSPVNPTATTSVTGVAELATTAETVTGTDTGRVITPAGLHGALAGLTDTTITASDAIVFSDATDSGALKEDTVQGILDLAGGGGFVFIGSATASDSATITVTGLDTTYKLVKIIGSDLISVDDDVEAWARIGDSGGVDPDASDYRWSTHTVRSTGTLAGDGDNADNQLKLSGATPSQHGAGTEHGCNFEMMLSQAGSSTLYSVLQWDLSFINNSDQALRGTGAGHRTAKITVDRVQFLFQSGNITSGKIAAYGIVDS